MKQKWWICPFLNQLIKDELMHNINYAHQHILDEHDFLGCCLNCRRSLMIIKPHVLGFYKSIKKHTAETRTALPPSELYRLYQVLDDVAHLEVGDRLGEMILTDPEISRALPAIRSYYAAFFKIHETYLAREILKAASPWNVLESSPLYSRYKALVENQVKAVHMDHNAVMAFIGCGPVPLSLILLNRFYGVRSIGLDTDAEAVNLAGRCVEHLGLEDGISIVQGDESRLWELQANAILVAALAEPKSRIFADLLAIEKKKGPVPVIYRTYTGMRAVLYRPVQPADIKGFKIVGQIEPTGRVNNTLVLLEPE